MDFNAESIQKLNGLSNAVLGKPAKDLTQDQLKTLLAMDMMAMPSELTVSTNDTRKTEVQFCTNSYGGTVKITLSDMKELIKRDVLEIDDPNEMLSKYLEIKSMFYQMMKAKYASMEQTLRDMSRDAQMKDRIVGVGRHAAS